MALFDGLSVPKWLSPTDLAESSSQQGAQFAQNFSSAYNRAAGVRDEKEMMDYKTALINRQQQQLATKLQPVAQALSAANTPAEAWDIASKNPQWMADPQTGPFVENFLQTQEKVAAAELSSIAGKAKIADTTDFAKKMSEILPEDRAAIKTMQPNKDGTPSAMQWQALSLAEERANVRRENEATVAEIDAELRGDTVTTTVTDKGVTKTYKPAPIAGQAVMPKEAVLSDGSKIVVNPKTGAFKFIAKDKKEKEFTGPQLLAISKHLKSVDDDDENAKKIDEFLALHAVEQITPKTNAPAKGSTTKSGLKYSVEPAK